jgi:integrase
VARGRIYNRIYNEEEYKEVNQLNKNIVEDYLEEYKQRKMKETTIKQYANDLRIVLLFIKRELNNENILSLNKKDFRKFSIWLSSDLKMSNARANRIMSAVRSLLTYIEEDDDYDYDNNVAKKVKGLPKDPVRVNEDNFFLSFEQITKLKNELIKRNRLQDAVLLCLSFDSAGRRFEVFQTLKHGLLEGNKTNIVTGKRGKKFPLIYLDDTKELIRKYLEERGEDDIDSLWISGTGKNKKPASYESLYNRVVQMSKILSEIEGKEIEFFNHSLRHSRIECLLQADDPRLVDENGNPKRYTLEQCQLFAHHSDPKTTQGYTKDHSEELINDMFNFS